MTPRAAPSRPGNSRRSRPARRWCSPSARRRTAPSCARSQEIIRTSRRQRGGWAGRGAGRAGASSPAATPEPAERSVTVATGHGKKAAHHIDAWLLQRASTTSRPAKHPTVDFAGLNLPIYADAARSPAERELPPRSASPRWLRRGGRRPERGGGPARPRRCLSCGNCFECDRCFAACRGGRHLQARPRPSLRDQIRALHGLRGVCRTVSLPRHGNDPRAGGEAESAPACRSEVRKEAK